MKVEDVRARIERAICPQILVATLTRSYHGYRALSMLRVLHKEGRIEILSDDLPSADEVLRSGWWVSLPNKQVRFRAHVQQGIAELAAEGIDQLRLLDVPGPVRGLLTAAATRHEEVVGRATEYLLPVGLRVEFNDYDLSLRGEIDGSPDLPTLLLRLCAADEVVAQAAVDIFSGRLWEGDHPGEMATPETVHRTLLGAVEQYLA